MFLFRSIQEQIFETRRENTHLQAHLAKTNADIEYIAMMTDVEIEDESVVTDSAEQEV